MGTQTQSAGRVRARERTDVSKRVRTDTDSARPGAGKLWGHVKLTVIGEKGRELTWQVSARHGQVTKRSCTGMAQEVGADGAPLGGDDRVGHANGFLARARCRWTQPNLGEGREFGN